jgi:hypothetical protein
MVISPMISDTAGAVQCVVRFFITATVLLLAAHCGVVFAQEQGGVDQRLLACSAIEDTAERAACFDEAVEAMQQDGAPPRAEAAAPAAIAEPPPAETAPVPEGPEAVTDQPVMQIEKDVADVEEEFVEFNATITRSNKSGLYHFVVELDNGQVWEETDGSRRPSLPKVGQTVRVTEGRFGGYRMKIGTANKLSWVRRLR